jgi:ubiquinone/menaquinone biosynthesis C-methylase UbiE
MSWYERRIFNPMLERELNKAEVDAERARLLAHASGRLLEVGPGTGLNFPHYPADIERITTISPEEELPALARERARERGATLRHFCQASTPWPFADGLFDTVVCTLVLCTVAEVDATLGEIKRVLAPGGRLLVFEHVLAEGALHAAVQHLVTPFTRAFACGCRCNRKTREAIEAAGFHWEQVESRSTKALSPLVSSVLFGVAQARG